MNDYVIFENPNLKYRYIVYRDGTIYNETTHKYIKPTKDKRRPTEPPIVYFKKIDNTRLFRYYDDFMAEMFNSDYEYGCKIIHRNGNVVDCQIENLYVAKNINVLTDIFNDNRKYKKINPDSIKDILNNKSLYYDYYISDDGTIFNATTCSYIEPFIDLRDKNKGYKRVNLYTSKNVKDVVHASVGRLVAWHFLPHVEGKNIVLYKDNDRSNVDKSNLYYGDNWDALTKFIEDDSIKNREFSSLNYDILGEEKWKRLEYDNIKFVDDYLISNYGRVYNSSKKFYVIAQDNGHDNPLGQCYKCVGLRVFDDASNTIFKQFSLHRLVAYTYCVNKNPNVNTCVNHINGNPSCNLAINLEWTTPEANVLHAISTNLIHSRQFESVSADNNWRTNVIIAWTFIISNNSLEDGYKLYNYYLNNYFDNILNVDYDSYKEFISSTEYNDFTKILSFYLDIYSNNK